MNFNGPIKYLRKVFTFSVLMIGLVALPFFCMNSFQENLIFFPEKLKESYVFKFPWPFEEMRIESEGVVLHALYFRVKNPKGCVLYFHGNAGSLRTWGLIAEDFITRGYDTAILDYRGYGKSGGEIKNEQMLHTDAENFYIDVMKRCPGKKKVLYGRSIGSGMASALALRHEPDLLILESPYTSVPDLAAVHYPFFPGFVVKYKMEVIKDVSKIKCPVVIVHGTNDDIIPHSMSRKIKEAAKDNCSLHLLDGGGHNDLSMFPEYHEILDSVLK